MFFYKVLSSQKSCLWKSKFFYDFRYWRFRIIPNQSAKCFESRFMQIGWKSIYEWIRTKFSMQAQIGLNWMFNSNQSKIGFVRIDTEWKFHLDQLKLECYSLSKGLSINYITTFGGGSGKSYGLLNAGGGGDTFE